MHAYQCQKLSLCLRVMLMLWTGAFQSFGGLAARRNQSDASLKFNLNSSLHQKDAETDTRVLLHFRAELRGSAPRTATSRMWEVAILLGCPG